MRTIWNGTLELGSVAVPVGLAPTVRELDPTFRVLHEACKSRVRLRSWCDIDEQLLDADDIVTAWELVPGEYLILDQDEKAALEPAPSRRIPIGCFIAASELDPQLARKRYWLVPSKTTVGRRAYVTLAEAMHALDAVALVRFTAWNSEQLGAIRTREGRLLELATLNFGEDLVEAEPVDAQPVEAEVELARELVQRHTRRLKPGDLASHERPRVQALLEAKLAGQPILRPDHDEAAPERQLAHVDLAHALRQSLRTAPRRRRARTTTIA